MAIQQARVNKSTIQAAFTFLDVTYHSIVRNIRSKSGNAALGILITMAQIMLLFAMFYFMMSILGMRGASIRGDFFVYLLSGIFLFFLHNDAIMATMSAGSVTSGMLQHGPMSTLLAMVSSTLAVLYINFLAACIIMFFVYMFRDGVLIENPLGLIAMGLLAWATGIGVGLLLKILKPFFPKFTAMFSRVYMRFNMISSGKFLVGNMIPGKLLVLFSWNPLFHCIDQARGEAFVNYYPRNSSVEYPVKFLLAAIVIGLMADYWHRRTVSASTGKR